jgi:hypothetical protein
MRPSRSQIWTALAIVAIAATPVQCAQDTSRLTPEQEARFQAEGILRRADNVVFHFTRETGYRREETRENRVASIVVTRRSVLIHKNEKVGIEITERSRRYDVHRREGRVLIHAGTGRTGEVWSFEPAEDAEGWTQDIRAVIRAGSAGTPPPRKGRSRTSRGRSGS